MDNYDSFAKRFVIITLLKCEFFYNTIHKKYCNIFFKINKKHSFKYF